VILLYALGLLGTLLLGSMKFEVVLPASVRLGEEQPWEIGWAW